MKVSITLDFDSPDHAIVALNHIDALRKGNFGETTTAATESSDASKPDVPPVAKPRKPRKPKAAPAPAGQAPEPTAPVVEVPSLADVQASVKGIFEKQGAVAALGLLKTFGVERAADMLEDKRAAFIYAAANL